MLTFLHRMGCIQPDLACGRAMSSMPSSIPRQPDPGVSHQAEQCSNASPERQLQLLLLHHMHMTPLQTWATFESHQGRGEEAEQLFQAALQRAADGKKAANVLRSQAHAAAARDQAQWALELLQAAAARCPKDAFVLRVRDTVCLRVADETAGQRGASR